MLSEKSHGKMLIKQRPNVLTTFVTQQKHISSCNKLDQQMSQAHSSLGVLNVIRDGMSIDNKERGSYLNQPNF